MSTPLELDVRHGECCALMAAMEPDSVDAIVTDPPYGLEFMGEKWDRLDGAVLTHATERGGFQDGPSGGNPFSRSRVEYGRSSPAAMQAWHEAWAREALRVLKAGGHLLAFGGTRTSHRLVSGLEDAGFEIRDVLAWLYGSGFPKSRDVAKDLDRLAGVSREDKFEGAMEQGDAGPSGNRKCEVCGKWLVSGDPCRCPRPQDEPQTDEAKRWHGWGTALKPAYEPCVLARKPFRGTVAGNVLVNGTGALNVSGCAIPVGDAAYARNCSGDRGHEGTRDGGEATSLRPGGGHASRSGRWPANVALDEVAAAMVDEQSGITRDGAAGTRRGQASASGFLRMAGRDAPWGTYGGEGGASRFFYTAKASSGERHYAGRNTHPTVKPVDLMRWLCRLVTPPGGLVLDPFCGSGSTGVAACAEGFRFVGLEQDAEHVATARRRIAGPLFAQEVP